MSNTLFILTKNPGEPNEEARLARLKNWPYATGFILEWAKGKTTCRLAEITEELAKKFYPKTKIETDL